MPFTDADGSPITCHTCPFKINTDCTAMPPTAQYQPNALTMPNCGTTRRHAIPASAIPP